MRPFILYFIYGIFSLLTLVSSVPPRTHDQCQFPRTWEDIWVEPKQGAKVSLRVNKQTAPLK